MRRSGKHFRGSTGTSMTIIEANRDWRSGCSRKTRRNINGQDSIARKRYRALARRTGKRYAYSALEQYQKQVGP